MDDRDNASLRAAVLAVLAKKIKDAQDHVKRDLLDDMALGDKLNPSLNGTRLGAVTKVKGRLSAAVVDPLALHHWVAQHYPEEMITTVRESFVEQILRTSAAVGKPCAPGGVLDVPGIMVRMGDPYISVRLTADAADVVAECWQQGQLDLDGTPRQLEQE